MIFDTDKLRDDKPYREEFRHRCETDHLFLADVVGLRKFVPRIHTPAVNIHFPKNRNLPIEEQHEKKNMLHLDPRLTYKTTLWRVDNLQWLLAFPETITMLNCSATQPLAEAISINTAIYLFRGRGGAPTPLQLAYPELVIDKYPTGTWDTPVRELGQLDATLDYTSPKSSQSGWHPWVYNADDMVDTENSGISADDNLRQRVIDKFDTNKYTVQKGGYTNLRGTRYHPRDLYGVKLESMDPDEWRVLIRGAMKVRSKTRLLPGEFPDEDDVELIFPDLPEMDYKHLRSRFYEKYEAFMCQDMNDPQGGNVPTFDEELYSSMLIAEERIPALGETFICWRLAYQGKDYMAKYAEGCAARILEGKVYIMDAWQGTYTPSRLAEKIVRECKRHQTGVVMMEDLPGIQYIEAHIRNEATRRNVFLRIQWLEFQDDDNDRFERMRAIEPQARAGRILISTATGKAVELRKQLLNFGIVAENGIVDCISRMASKVPVSLLRTEIEDEELELQRNRRHELMNAFVYGQQDQHGGVDDLAARRQQEELAAQAARESAFGFGLTDILGGLEG